MGIFFACCISLPTTRLSVTSGIGTRPSMMTRKPTVGDGAASSGACGHPSAWPVLRRLPWPRRFLAQAIRGSEPGAQVLEPLHLTRILGPPPDVCLHSLLSFLVFCSPVSQRLRCTRSCCWLVRTPPLRERRVLMRGRWVLLKIPRCDIDGVGEGK